MNEQSNGMILNRGKHARQTEVHADETVVSHESKNEPQLEVVAQMTTNSTLASQFPDWDLKPPATLIKRRSSKLI
jgi:hypothetical protein